MYYAGLGEPHIIDVTPCHDRTSIYTSGVNRQQRGEEIAAWLEEHPEVTQYVIFDDDFDMTEEQKKKHFVQTHWNTGITHKHIEKALKIFMGGSPI